MSGTSAHAVLNANRRSLSCMFVAATLLVSTTNDPPPPRSVVLHMLLVAYMMA